MIPMTETTEYHQIGGSDDMNTASADPNLSGTTNIDLLANVATIELQSLAALCEIRWEVTEVIDTLVPVRTTTSASLVDAQGVLADRMLKDNYNRSEQKKMIRTLATVEKKLRDILE